MKRSNSTSADELVSMATHACLIAKDAATNLQEILSGCSRLAALTLRQCESELDELERSSHQKLPQAITRVSEDKARELLVCSSFIGNLERITDLLLWVGQRLAVPGSRISSKNHQSIADMVSTLVKMIEQIHGGFVRRDAELAQSVLRLDANLDRLRSEAFHRTLMGNSNDNVERAVETLLMVQAIERAGDHATNLAEELVYLIEHRSIRHTRRKTLES
jgi:phosphate transport system protein